MPTRPYNSCTLWLWDVALSVCADDQTPELELVDWKFVRRTAPDSHTKYAENFGKPGEAPHIAKSGGYSLLIELPKLLLMAVLWDRCHKSFDIFPTTKGGNPSKTRSVASPVTMGSRICLILLSGLRSGSTMSPGPHVVISKKEAMLFKYLVCRVR